MKNKRDEIYQDELFKLYIEENKSRKELAEHFNVSESLIKECLAKFKIKKSISKRVENTQKTCLIRYGTTNAGGVSKTIEKIKKTTKEKYGNESYFKTNDYKEKLNKYLKNNSIENVFQLATVKEKIKQTNLKNFGFEHNMQNPLIVQKAFNSKKTNNSFKKSKSEDKIFEYLIGKFIDVERQYVSDEYPFHCDFYIPDRDLYIEYQGFWTHGWNLNKPYGAYDFLNEEHRELLSIWKQKANNGHKAYENAIKTWTMRDPLKRQTAKNKHLNWLEFWTFEEFMEWFENFNEIRLKK